MARRHRDLNNRNIGNVSPISVCVVLVGMFQIYQVSGIECGTLNVIPDLMRGGNETVKGAWPFLVALHYYQIDGSKILKCSGTLISKKHVLTGNNETLVLLVKSKFK